MRRRRFLATSAAALAAPTMEAAPTLAADQARLPINVSSYYLDRTAALFERRVKIEGVDATFHEGKIGDMNTAAFTGAATVEITEVGLHPFILAFANDDFRDYALLPIPLLRQFRHKSIFVHRDAGINNPEDLKGRRVGTPGYSSSSVTWIRGILEDEYGVIPSDMVWVVANKDSSTGEAGAMSKQENLLPDGVTIEQGKPGLDESELLLEGEVDALIHAAAPAAYIDGDPRVVRLFQNAGDVEKDYFTRTGIFPIMHVLAIRRDTAAEHPWLARAVFEAYSAAKMEAYRDKDRLTWVTDMLPWYASEVEDTRALMGRNFYPYGFEANQTTFETLFEYSYRQGLAKRILKSEEVFLPGTLGFSEA